MVLSVREAEDIVPGYSAELDLQMSLLLPICFKQSLFREFPSSVFFVCIKDPCVCVCVCVCIKDPCVCVCVFVCIKDPCVCVCVFVCVKDPCVCVSVCVCVCQRSMCMCECVCLCVCVKQTFSLYCIIVPN